MRRFRILLVDDDPQIIECLQTALDAGGYDVIVATDGREALVRAERDAPDLIVLDMVIPQWSGLHVLDRLRRQVKHSAKIVMLTGSDDDRNRANAAARGVDAFLGKPCDVGEVLRTIAGLLETSPPGEEA